MSWESRRGLRRGTMSRGAAGAGDDSAATPAGRTAAAAIARAATPSRKGRRRLIADRIQERRTAVNRIEGERRGLMVKGERTTAYEYE
jgi:hypothetical protein